MAEKDLANLEIEGEQENYVPPIQKTVSEIVATDAEDESLNKYVLFFILLIVIKNFQLYSPQSVFFVRQIYLLLLT